MSVVFFPARWGIHEAGSSVRSHDQSVRSHDQTARSLGESIYHGLVYLGVAIAVGLIVAAIINKH